MVAKPPGDPGGFFRVLSGDMFRFHLQLSCRLMRTCMLKSTTGPAMYKSIFGQRGCLF
jgi:hypothetical protein